MLTSEQIAAAKRTARYTSKTPHHEHDDCIRIAYAWLDAQVRNRTRTPDHYLPLKHIIEAWGGRYVSEDDVVVAAHAHPGVFGTYPAFNLSKRRVLPGFARLDGIAEAGTMMGYRAKMDDFRYARREDDAGAAHAA